MTRMKAGLRGYLQFNKYTHTHILLYNSIYSTRFYVVMSHQFLYFRQNLLIPLLLFNKERSGEVR